MGSSYSFSVRFKGQRNQGPSMICLSLSPPSLNNERSELISFRRETPRRSIPDLDLDLGLVLDVDLDVDSSGIEWFSYMSYLQELTSY